MIESRIVLNHSLDYYQPPASPRVQIIKSKNAPTEDEKANLEQPGNKKQNRFGSAHFKVKLFPTVHKSFTWRRRDSILRNVFRNEDPCRCLSLGKHRKDRCNSPRCISISTVGTNGDFPIREPLKGKPFKSKQAVRWSLNTSQQMTRKIINDLLASPEIKNRTAVVSPKIPKNVTEFTSVEEFLRKTRIDIHGVKG